MSSAASARTSQASSSPPADAVAGRVPPAASTVVISASSVPRCSIRSAGASRSEAAKIGTPDAAGGVDRVGQGVHVRGVPGRLLRPVEEDPDPRGVRPVARAVEARGSADGRSTPQTGLLGRRLEALAGEQDGVGEEGVQLARGSPGRPGRGRGGPRRRRRSAPSTAPSARRRASARRRGRPSACRTPGARPAAQVWASRGCGRRSGRPRRGRRRAVSRALARVGDVVGAARAGRQQVGVGGGQQGDPGHASGSSPEVRAPGGRGRSDAGQSLTRQQRAHSGGTVPESHRVPGRRRWRESRPDPPRGAHSHFGPRSPSSDGKPGCQSSARPPFPVRTHNLGASTPAHRCGRDRLVAAEAA